MRRRSRRGPAKVEGAQAEQTLDAAVVARVTAEPGSASAGEIAVRGALAHAEVDRPIDRVAVVTLDDAPFARVLGAVLGRDRDVTVTPLDDVRVDEVDGAFAVVRRSTPAADVVASLDRLQPVLLGVVLVDDAKRPAATTPPAVQDGDAVAEQTHRDAALRRLTEEVERQRAELEERERELGAQDGAVDAEREQALDEREAQLDERAASLDAREQRIEERVRELETREEEVGAAASRELAGANERIEELEAELAELREQQAAAEEDQPVEPGTPGDYNLRQLEQLLRDAQLRNEPQAEEWAYYVPLLGEHADFEGRLPPEFNALVANVFGI